MEARRSAELDEESKALRHGWCLGGTKFRQELLRQIRQRTGPNHGGSEPRESEPAWAQELIAEELKRRRWTDADLVKRRKGDAQKVKLARRLRQETTMTLRWIAQRVNMGAAGSVANLLRDASTK